MQNNNREVLIVGAGPTGLTLGCELLRRGIDCRVIDKNNEPSQLSKALGISSSSLEIFDRMGIAEKIISSGLKIQDIEVYWKQKRFLHIDYRYLRNIKFPFVLNLAQTETEKHLSDYFESLGGKIERNISLEELNQQDGVVNVMLRHANHQREFATYKEVIGCDGSQSTVRKLLGLSFSGQDYGLYFIYADVKLDWNGDPNKIVYYADQGNLLIIIPTIAGVYRIVGLVTGDKNNRPLPNLEDMQNYVNQYGPGGIELKNPTQFGSVPLYDRLASTNRVKNVYLAGDAFHLFSPIGGQGMNTGIQDAYNLAWKLAYVKKGYAKATLLDSYEYERHGMAKSLIGNIEKITTMITREDKDQDPLAQSLVPKFSNRAILRKRLPKQFSGFNYVYEKSHFIRDNTHYANQNLSIGAYVSEYDFLRKEKDHALLLFMKQSEKQNYPQGLIEYIKDLYGKFISIHSLETNSVEGICFVRPDGYVAYQGELNDIATLRSYLDDFYLKAA